MKKFEVGHVYFDQYACDHETISTIKIIKRTPKTVVFERNGKTRRAKLYEDSNGEYIIPDHYSMACVYRAERELLDEKPEQVNAPVEQEQPAAADNTIRFPATPRLLPRLPPLATLSLARWLTTPCAKWCFPSLTRATCGQRNWTSLQPSPTAPAAWPDKGRCWAFRQRLFFCSIYSQMRVKMLSCLLTCCYL